MVRLRVSDSALSRESYDYLARMGTFKFSKKKIPRTRKRNKTAQARLNVHID